MTGGISGGHGVPGQTPHLQTEAHASPDELMQRLNAIRGTLSQAGDVQSLVRHFDHTYHDMQRLPPTGEAYKRYRQDLVAMLQILRRSLLPPT